ncbi:FliG C-terminal domain-containing protein [Paramagnetospirillum magnetotacticum]|uniref:FliG C-terminal domain-containing protein n=1 Tax=Paramagnetospirillum magnetotacticum TaxID=188 RepID=UPI0009E4357E
MKHSAGPDANFERLSWVSAQTAWAIWQRADGRTIRLALYGSGPAVLSRFLSVLSGSCRRSLLVSLGTMHPVPADSMKAAQDEIMALVASMEAQGDVEWDACPARALPRWHDIFLGNDPDPVLFDILLTAIRSCALDGHGRGKRGMRNALRRIVRWSRVMRH